MKAIVKLSENVGDINLIEIPEPICGDDEVKIRVKACGICATDLHIVEGSYPWKVGVPLGHEFSGKIVEVGKNVTKFKKGDRVASCMEGGFAKYAVKKEDDWVFAIPDNISYEEAALLEPLSAAANSVINKSNILPQDIVLIEGAGTIGLFVLEFVKLQGGIAIVSGTSKDKDRLKLAEELGADYTIDIQKESLKELVEKVTDKKGVDTVIECSGSQNALDSGIALLKTAGQLTQVGIFSKAPIIDLVRVVYHSQKIVGSIAFDKETWYRCIKLLGAEKVNTKKLVSHEIPLDEWKRAFEITHRQEGFRVLLIP